MVIAEVGSLDAMKTLFHRLLCLDMSCGTIFSPIPDMSSREPMVDDLQ
jgi:hypothetical protein